MAETGSFGPKRASRIACEGLGWVRTMITTRENAGQLVSLYDRYQEPDRLWGEGLGCWRLLNSPLGHLRGRGMPATTAGQPRTTATAAQHASHHSWQLQISTRFLWNSPRIVAVKMNQAPPAAGGYPLTYPLLAATQI